MAEWNAERVLESLAYGNDWKLDNLGRMITAVDGVRAKLQSVIDALPTQWQGQTAQLAQRRLRTHHTNLGKYRAGLFQVQALVTGMGESYCSATCANTTRATEAQRLLSALPGGMVPSWMHDAVNQGGEVSVPGFGKVDLNSGLEGVSNWFGGQRNAAALEAVKQMAEIIQAESERLHVEIAYDPIEIGPGEGDQQTIPDFKGLSDYPTGNPSGMGGPGFPGSVGGVNPWNPGGTGGPGTGGPITGGPGVGGPGGPEWETGGPGTAWPNPSPGGPDWWTPGGPGTGIDGGPGSSGGDDSRGPSVDSNLDGSGGGGGLRPALGAAGLGAVGLAAGAKLASGSGAGGGLGGLFGGGAGGAGAGGAAGAGAGGAGLRGVAATAGSGGAGSGAAGANAGAGAGRGAGRPGGMMMGGGGAGGAKDKKSARSGLGYIAPSLEDEGDGGPAADASRGGSRG